MPIFIKRTFLMSLRRVVAAGILVIFAVTTIIPANAQSVFNLPYPGARVGLSPEFSPLILKGIKVYPANPFRFEFIIDKGDSNLTDEAVKEETTRLINYFLASLTVPEKDLWVNLSPYEKDRIIPDQFGVTEMGRDLLAEDYLLKQITASLIYPEEETGKKFWKRVYEEAAKKFGTTDIPVNTFNKVWIVPEKAIVYENEKAGTAYVVESKLKVMLEEDYLSLKEHVGAQSEQQEVKEANQIGNQIVREIVIPELTREVNENKNFAQLRQVYNSLILATWYKKKVKDSILAQVYADKNKVAGVNIDDPDEKQKIYEQYLQAFKKGVYNYIKEDVDPVTQETIPRKYFSGGFGFDKVSSSVDIEQKSDSAMLSFINNAYVGKMTALLTVGVNLLALPSQLKGEAGTGALSGAEAFEQADHRAASLPRLEIYQPKMSALQQSVKDAIRQYEEKRRDWQQTMISQGAHAAQLQVGNPELDKVLDILRSMDKKLQTDSNGSLIDSTGFYSLFDGVSKLGEMNDPVIRNVNSHANGLLGFSYLHPYDPNKPDLIMIPGAGGEWMYTSQFNGILKDASTDYNIIGYTFDPTKSLAGLRNTLINDFTDARLYETQNLIVTMSYGNTVMHSALWQTIQPGYNKNLFSQSYVLSIGFLPGGSASFKGVPRLFVRAVTPMMGKYSQLIKAMDPKNPQQSDLAVNIEAVQRATKEIFYIETKADKYIYFGLGWDQTYRLNRDLILDSLDKDHWQWIFPPSAKELGNHEGEHNNLLFAPEAKEKIKKIKMSLEGPPQSKLKAEEKSLLPAEQPGEFTKGGIDLTPANLNMQIQNNGDGLKLQLDPVMLEQLQNAIGFEPVIINIQPMIDFRLFLGFMDNDNAPQTARL